MIHRTVVYHSPDGSSFDLTAYPSGLSDFDGIYIPSVNAQSQVGPYQDGSTYLGSNLGERELSFTVGYVGSFDLGDIQAYRRTLQSVFNPKTNDRLGVGYVDITEDGVLRRAYCRVDAVTMTPISRRKAGNDAVITLVGHDPYLYSTAEEYSNASAVTPVSFGDAVTTFFPLGTAILGFANVDGVVLTSDGDGETGVVITVTGPCNIPAIYNATTGETIRWNAYLDSGETLVIDTNEVTVKKNGVKAIQYLDTSSVFWKLQPGDNSVYCTENGTPTGAPFEITWQDKYVGF